MLTTILFVALNNPTMANAPTETPTVEADARAKRYYENGSTLYAEGRYADSITAFQEAYRLSGRHALLFNIASAQERLGDLAGAIDSLSQYRIHADPTEQAVLGRRIDNLNARLVALKRTENANNEQQITPTDAKPENKSENIEGNTAEMTPISIPKPSLRPWIGGAATLGAIGLIGGTYFSTTAAKYHSELESLCQDGICPTMAEDISQFEVRALDSAKMGWSLGLIGGGIASALWFWDKNQSDEALP